MILFKTLTKNKFCIYCFKNDKNYTTILINIDQNKVFKPLKDTKQNGYSYRLSSNKICLGAGQIMIKNAPS